MRSDVFPLTGMRDATRPSLDDISADVAEATVFLVDDDAIVRDALGRLLRSAGWNSRAFASAQEFLDAMPFTGVGCLVLDVSMPGMSGPDLQAWMLEHDCTLPIIFLSGRCNVPMSVNAMRSGAIDVLEKPADDEIFLTAITSAFARHRQDLVHRRQQEGIEDRLALLTGRERQVLEQVSLGRLNKQIASDLGIAEKTVKVHRARAMAKMGVRSAAALAHLCEQLDAWP